MVKQLKNWDLATDNLAKYFVEKYFGKEYIFNDDFYFVGSQDEDREVLAINDYFFDLENIVDFIRYNYMKKEVFEYYDYALDCYNKNENPINIKNYEIKKINSYNLDNFSDLRCLVHNYSGEL